jgi:GMP synthase PP-ATPase subunit
MRKGEVKLIQEALKRIGFENLHVEDASDKFFEKLKGVYDPEEVLRRLIDPNGKKKVCIVFDNNCRNAKLSDRRSSM